MSRQNGHRDAAALQAEIIRTRAELGETVQALAARADVKARLRESATQTRERARQRASDAVGTVRDSVRGVGSATSRDPVRWAVVVASAAALLVMALVVRGRRG